MLINSVCLFFFCFLVLLVFWVMVCLCWRTLQLFFTNKMVHFPNQNLNNYSVREEYKPFIFLRRSRSLALWSSFLNMFWSLQMAVCGVVWPSSNCVWDVEKWRIESYVSEWSPWTKFWSWLSWLVWFSKYHPMVETKEGDNANMMD